MFVCPTCARSSVSGGFCTEDGSALADASGDPLLGQSVDRYRLARLLGRGGMGTVYLGVQPSIGSRVAVKVLNPTASLSPDLLERFFAEAKAVNVIRHESIVNVIDLATLPDGRPYIIMEYLEGAPLSAHFGAHRLAPAQLVRLCLEVLGALGAAHAVGITHRDLKPDNIFVTALGRAKVLDFGIAKLVRDPGATDDATRTGALLGTPHYMSPEQALGQPVDSRSDLYSLGVILYEGTTGNRPFDSDSLFNLLRQHVEQEPAPPRSLRPELSPALEAVILRALAKRREQRFQTAAELDAALRAVLPELPGAELGSLPPPTPAAVTPMLALPARGSSLASTTSAGAVSSTLPSPSAGARSRTGLFIGVAGVAFAALALGVAAIAVLFGLGIIGPEARAGGAAKGGGLDGVAELDKMREEARRHLPDAELTTISLVGVNRDGSVDFSDNKHAAAYVFRSPSASKSGNNCLVSVSKSLYGTFAAPFADQNFGCKQPVIHAPRCTPEEIMKDAPKDKKIGSLVFSHGNGTWFWAAVIEGGASFTRPDNC